MALSLKRSPRTSYPKAAPTIFGTTTAYTGHPRIRLCPTLSTPTRLSATLLIGAGLSGEHLGMWKGRSSRTSMREKTDRGSVHGSLCSSGRALWIGANPNMCHRRISSDYPNFPVIWFPSYLGATFGRGMDPLGSFCVLRQGRPW